MKKNVVIGFFGTTLDTGVTAQRWEKWRPSVSLCAHKSFKVDRLELFVTRDAHLELVDQLRTDIASISPGTEVVVRRLELEDPWNFPETYGALFDYARKQEFEEDADYYVHLTTGTHTAQICLFILTESHHFPAKLVDSHLVKGEDEPWRGRVEVIDLNLAMYDQLAGRFKQEKADSETVLKNGIATANATFNSLITKIEKVCLRSNAPILLTGPTGAGKSELAKRIFELRTRRHKVEGRLVEVNCATLVGDNALSTLFGHKKGAFTGATTDRDGLLKAADKGTVFLDEIGTLGEKEQAMLLRALETKSFLPLGADKEVQSDFELIAGTNADLNAEVKKGIFRGDLLARINTWSFRLPALAERPEDIAPNLEYELDQISAKLKCRVSFSKAAQDKYLEFALRAPWHGNFRDLAASVMRMATLAEGGRILQADVADEIFQLKEQWEGLSTPTISRDLQLVQRVMPDKKMDAYQAAQAEVVLKAILDTDNMAEAGRLLFAVSRLERTSVNDSQRIRAVLVSLGLDYKEVKRVLNQGAVF